ncbi:hypothetical protein EDE11_11258 [Methylomonas methanica]|uniref:Uncharacterized protein n=1 Tax=Methylomonas methanica TaxID=421 RepID=A0ABY2CNY4_METMH|nr:hypothetical protein EDE11_11258 [Methylomonas methanica]
MAGIAWVALKQAAAVSEGYIIARNNPCNLLWTVCLGN